MQVANFKDVKENKIETFPYKGKPYEVKEVYIRWLSQAGAADSVEYGLRLFRIGVGGEIPLHNHLYHQTMYILSGSALCRCHDHQSDEVIEEKQVAAGDYIYLPTMEPHSMLNIGEDEVAFLCCIANVYEDEQM